MIDEIGEIVEPNEFNIDEYSNECILSEIDKIKNEDNYYKKLYRNLIKDRDKLDLENSKLLPKIEKINIKLLKNSNKDIGNSVVNYWYLRESFLIFLLCILVASLFVIIIKLSPVGHDFMTADVIRMYVFGTLLSYTLCSFSTGDYRESNSYKRKSIPLSKKICKRLIKKRNKILSKNNIIYEKFENNKSRLEKINNTLSDIKALFDNLDITLNYFTDAMNKGISVDNSLIFEELKYIEQELYSPDNNSFSALIKGNEENTKSVEEDKENVVSCDLYQVVESRKVFTSEETKEKENEAPVPQIKKRY